ncbi:acyltransferase [Candidatus Woesearchaeota archaeon]|jgi:N-carbamoylputrescine amidase|nr:acyltransferase [Candidatus Woesearchaeota archaeon]MDP6647775.1 nitrilase-related carbon-nitrogen hydrolase [Candidatus Woesearchaeota archaeon]|tara:strand:+ start:3989 stop:4852 length:864 start_codon:yes stop_codon:yes gene_type:complete
MNSQNKIKIGLVQTESSSELRENFDKTSKYINEAAKKGATIICLQELFAMQYLGQKEDKELFALAEKIPGKITNFLSDAAKTNKITLVGGSLFEKAENDKYYNTSLIFDPEGKTIAKYRKIHIPHDEKYFEQFYFSSGDLGYVQAKVPNATIAPLICYDQWYPEPARINALKGAQIIFYPTAIGWLEDFRENEPFSAKRWENAMCAHASMNGIYVAAVNRVGKENDLDFWGSSFVADPYGEVVNRASNSNEEVLVVDLDLDKIQESREGWRFLKNRQVGSYGDLMNK